MRGILLAQFRSTCPLEGNQYKSVLTDHLSPMLKPSILMGEGSFFSQDDNIFHGVLKVIERVDYEKNVKCMIWL